MCTTLGVSALNRHSMEIVSQQGSQRKAIREESFQKHIPFNGVLSSNNRPKWIRRMLLGLLGWASHSSRHSLSINSFNVYTLILNGSFFPLSVTPGTLTFRFVKYFSSSL